MRAIGFASAGRIMTHCNRLCHPACDGDLPMGCAIVLNGKVKTACDVAGASRSESAEAPFAQKALKHLPTSGRSATAWIAATMLAMTWASETQSSPDHARHLADAQHAMAARNFDSDGIAGNGDFGRLPPPGRGSKDKSLQVAQATTGNAGQTPEREHNWADTQLLELTIARRDIELLQRLVQEQDRAEQLEQALAAARRDVETQTALAGKASEQASRLKQAGESGTAEVQTALQQERERSARLEQDLVAARRDVETQTALAKASEEASRPKQASESSEAVLQKSLQQGRERSARLEQDLAAARRDVETQTALAAKATEEVLRGKRAAEADAAELKQSMQKERERADSLAQGLSMTRSALYAYEARARKLEDEAAELRQAAANGAPSLRKSAQDGRDQTKRLEQDLATARRDLDTQAALAAKASEEIARTRQAAERDSASLRSSLQQERARVEQLERDLALAKQVGPNAVTVGSTARDKPTENAKSVADGSPAAGVRSDAQPNSKKAGVAAALLARASALLGQGDIGAARIVLERAVEMGSVQASFALAETYDPLILAKWGTLGTRGDAVRAQDLYAKADAAGIKEAKARIEALRR